MKSSRSPIAFAILLSLLSIPGRCGTPVVHLSPLGNDADPGTAEKPVRSLARARDLARETHAGEIILAPGTYPLAATLVLDARDSGVVWKGGGKAARITGSVAVPSSSIRTTDDPVILERLLPEVRGKVREIDLRSLGITEFGEVGPHGFGHPYIPAPAELFIADRAMTLSQWPKSTDPAIPLGKVTDQGSLARNRQEPKRGGVFGLKTDRPARWTNATDVWITGFFHYGYADDLVKVASFDLTNKTVATAQPHCYGFASGKPWNTWRAINLLEEISLPGEYILDRQAGKIYFLPPEGETAPVEVSVLKDPLVVLSGASRVTFDGISFGSSRGVGVCIAGGEGNRIRNSVFRNLGMYALSIGKPASGDSPKRIPGKQPGVAVTLGKDNGVEHCLIEETGAGGVLLGGGERTTLEPGGNFVENCEIRRFNRWDRTYRGAVNIDGVGNRIRHCHLHDAPGAVILLHGNDHLVEFNEIHDVIMTGDDMGAYYTGRNPTERGTVVRYNYWHDLGPAHHTYGLYFDDCGGDGTVVFGNVFRNAGASGSIFVNGGCDFTIENNIFIDAPSKQSGALRGSPSTANQSWTNCAGWFTAILKGTPVTQSPWKERYPQLLDYLEFKNSTGDTRGLLFARNLLINSAVNPCKFTMTNNWSTMGDPGFVDAARGNYALRPDSEVFKQIPGFQPIPFDKIGIETNAP